MNPVRILLADDHSILRAGIRAILQAIPGATVVGEAQDGREALDQIQSLRPDVVFMDIGMKNLNGLETTARVAQDEKASDSCAENACPGVGCRAPAGHGDRRGHSRVADI